MIVLGITDTLKPTQRAYLDWLGTAGKGIDLLTLSYVKMNASHLERCDGVVFTGGSDIHPAKYGREDARRLVHDVDERRDEFESGLFRSALDRGIPILGICRGMQLINVALGGTLIPDVQYAGYDNHEKLPDRREDRRHGIRVVSGSTLHSITGVLEGEVNSSHHQAVDRLGKGLRASAYSPDGLVEGTEWEEPAGNPFLALVQWHPERMKDTESPLARGLLDGFIAAVETSKHEHVTSKS